MDKFHGYEEAVYSDERFWERRANAKNLYDAVKDHVKYCKHNSQGCLNVMLFLHMYCDVNK